MEKQISTITPADTGTMMLPGAAMGALGFTGANIAKQLLAKKFKGYGHLATSSLASAGFGALVGGLGGSFINKKPRSNPVQTSINTEMNNNYINKQAGILSSVNHALSPVRRYVGILRGKNIETAKKGMEKAWNIHGTVYPKILDKELAAAKASGNYTNFNKAAQRSSNWREMYDKQVQHFNDAKQLTKNVRIATGVGTAGALGAGASVANRGQEKRAGIASYTKQYWNLLSGKSLKRAVKAEQKARKFGYEVYPGMIAKQFNHTVSAPIFSNAFSRRSAVLQRMSNRMDKWNALEKKLSERTQKVRSATSGVRFGTGVVGLGALTAASNAADRNTYNKRVKHASIDSLTAAVDPTVKKTLQFIGKHPWITGGLGVGAAMLASKGVNKGLNKLTDNTPGDPATQVDGSSAYYKNKVIADATKGVRNYLVGDALRTVGYGLRTNNHPFVGRLVGSIGSGTQFSGKVMGAKGLYDAYKGFTAPN